MSVGDDDVADELVALRSQPLGLPPLPPRPARRDQLQTAKRDNASLIAFALNALTVVKMSHWAANTTGAHEAFDEAYDALNKHLDRAVEVYLAAYDKLPLDNYSYQFQVTASASRSKFQQYDALYTQAEDEARRLMRAFDQDGHPELANIMQEVLADIYQCKYRTIVAGPRV